ncbi:MAG: hypothetical protein IJ761_04010 [Bacteroidales bacterium]|nr:hypothetical protein [Bacteroidales bacterium]
MRHILGFLLAIFEYCNTSVDRADVVGFNGVSFSNVVAVVDTNTVYTSVSLTVFSFSMSLDIQYVL